MLGEIHFRDLISLSDYHGPKFTSLPSFDSKKPYNALQKNDPHDLRYLSGSYYASHSFQRKCVWLGLYLLLTTGLTVHNKFTMTNFPYPCVVTGIHALFGSIGSAVIRPRQGVKPIRLNWSEGIAILLFSILYTINIAVSNASLEFVTLPMHQALRSLNPLLVVLVSQSFLNKKFSSNVYYALLLLCSGVALTTMGDHQFSAYGVAVTLSGTYLAASKQVITTSLLRGSSRLSPADLLFYLSPLACIQSLLIAYYTGEAKEAINALYASEESHKIFFDLGSSGCLAVSLNLVSFTASQYTGALAMSVTENIRQMTTIILAALWFGYEMNTVNAIGFGMTILGGMWYAKVEYDGKKSARNFESPPGSPTVPDDRGTFAR